MSQADLGGFVQALFRSGLLPEEEIRSLVKQALTESRIAATPRGLADWLVDQGKVTRYQADSLIRGHTRFFLDDYLLLDRIGAGRMAGVYQAVHKLGMNVAVKILPPSKAKQPEALARFRREAKLALQLDHPHVVKTFHAGTSDGLHYIAMEFLEGETLEERLAAKGKLSPFETLRLAEQVLLALEHLNEKNIVHRDLKPGNIMLATLPGKPAPGAPSYAVKLLDVGLGRALFSEEETPEGEEEDLTAAGAIIGTPDYMAPEQARDSHAADIRSDLYSLGCVLYECLTGHVPFPERNTVEKVVKHATQMPPPPDPSAYPQAESVNRWLWKLILKKPADRFQTPGEALKGLQALLAPSRARPSGQMPVAKPAAKPPSGSLPAPVPVAVPAPHPVLTAVPAMLPANPQAPTPVPGNTEPAPTGPPLWVAVAVAATGLLLLLAGLVVYLIRAARG